MSVDRAKSPQVVAQIPVSPIARFMFADTRMAWLWLVLRLIVGMGWLAAGVSKVTGFAFGVRPNGPPWWFMADSGAALKAFVDMATSHGGAQPVPGMPDWLVGAPGWYASFLQSVVLPNAAVFAYVVAFGEILIGLGLLLGCLTGIAAFFGLLLSANFLLAGVVDPNLVNGVEALFLMLAWRVAGYYGVDRWLLPRLGTPWTGSLTHPSRVRAAWLSRSPLASEGEA
jgi:thiosulfate dehydrogenase (quinone) large subunit